MPIKKLTPTFSLDKERLSALEQIVPEAFADGLVNWETLKEALGEYLEDEAGNAEHFGLFWHGKREARRLASIPSKGALAPALGEGVDEETTENIFIEGDNLEILKLLQKSYTGRIKMIYLDPPYNTGQDFIYKDNFAEPLEEYLKKTGQSDEEGTLLTTNTKADGRFHTNWLNMMYPRLRLARNLLRKDGVIFISIDDNEIHNLRQLMNEIFGDENWVGTLIWKGATDNNPTRIATEHEYILCYAKELDNVPSTWKNKSVDAKATMLQEYERLKKKYKGKADLIQVDFRRFIKANAEALTPITHYDRVDETGPYTGSRKVHNPKPGGYKYNVSHPVTGKVCVPPANGYRYPEERMKELINAGKILFGEDETQIIQIKEYLKDYEGKLSSVIHLDSRAGSNELTAIFGVSKVFTNPKPAVLLREIFDFCLEPSDLVLDFFAGSGTTAQSIFELNSLDKGNRKFILVQLPASTENPKLPTIAEITKERIRRVSHKAKEELADKLKLDEYKPDFGFKVFKLQASNFKAWQDYQGESADELASLFTQFETPLADGWNEHNVLTEILLLEGFPLNSKVTVDPQFKRNRVFLVESDTSTHRLYVSLDKKITDATVNTVAGLDEQDVFICFDSALTDTAKVELTDAGNVRTI